jgi:toxin-antitoxin system PIN domain toxin
MLLLDTNVWVAIALDTNAKHPAAKQWFDGLTDELCHFCRLTQQGFLRLATNQKAAGAAVLTLDEAWLKYDTFLSDPRVAFVADPPGIEAQWRAYTKGQTFSTHVWNDAYLAALALLAGMEVITFDRGFTRYTNTPCTILL